MKLAAARDESAPTILGGDAETGVRHVFATDVGGTKGTRKGMPLREDGRGIPLRVRSHNLCMPAKNRTRTLRKHVDIHEPHRYVILHTWRILYYYYQHASLSKNTSATFDETAKNYVYYSRE